MAPSHKYGDEAEIEKTFKELGIYLIFLLITTIVCVSLNDQYMFYFNDMIKRLFLIKRSLAENDSACFYDIITIEDWWHFMKTTFLNGLHGRTSISDENDSESSDLVAEFHKDKYIGNNLLLGQPRIRQIRITNDSCKIHNIFKKYFPICYSEFSLEYIETDNSKIKSSYEELSFFESITTWGKLTDYPDGGFIESLGKTRKENENIIQNLMDMKWIDRGTRLLSVEFSLYNVNVNLFCVVKFFTEVSPTGGLIPSATVKSYKLLTLWTWFDYFYLTCLIIFYLMIIYYTISDINDCRLHIRRYWLSAWILLDLLIILIGYISLCYNIIRNIYIKNLFQRYKDNPNYYLHLNLLTFYEFLYKNLMAILLFIVWIKIFKYINFNRTMKQFSTTLNKCSKDLIGFGLMFLIVLIAFALFGYLLFGTVNSNFQTFRISIITLLRMILGDFNYPAIETANRIFGPIYFLIYVFIVYFILLNMFVAIIIISYTKVKNENPQSSFIVADYLRKMFIRFKNFICCKQKSTINQQFDENQLELENNINNIENEKLNYDKNVEKQKTTVRNSQMVTKRVEFKADDDRNKVSANEIKALNERVNNIESTLNLVLKGIDALVNKLETERLNKMKKS